MKRYKKFLLFVLGAFLIVVTVTSAFAYGPVVLPTPCNVPYTNYGRYFGDYGGYAGYGAVQAFGGWVKVHYRYHEPYTRWYNEFPQPRYDPRPWYN